MHRMVKAEPGPILFILSIDVQFALIHFVSSAGQAAGRGSRNMESENSSRSGRLRAPACGFNPSNAT